MVGLLGALLDPPWVLGGGCALGTRGRRGTVWAGGALPAPGPVSHPRGSHSSPRQRFHPSRNW